MKDQINRFEKEINYIFKDKSILITALTHSSYVKEHNKGGKSNERLEFLGDAFFDAIIGEKLFRIFPDKEEGFLSRTRATLVCEKSLAEEARKISLGEYLILGKGEEKCGGRNRKSILADAMEAIIGAVYIDGGFEAARDMVLKLFDEVIEDTRHGKYIVTDYKTELQEVLQSRKITDIRYVLISETGPDHDKTFEVELRVSGRRKALGSGKSKKQAEQEAARVMLEREHDVL